MVRSITFALFVVACLGTRVVSQEQQPPTPRPAPASRGARGGFVPGSGFVAPPSSSATAPAESGSRAGLNSRPIPPSRPLPTTAGESLTFDVLIAERIQPVDSPTAEKILELERTGKLDVINRMQVTTLEEMPAFVQFGALTARVIGRTTTGLTVMPIYNDINVGSIVQVTGRVGEDGAILAQVFVEQSGIAGGEEGPFDPKASLPPKSIERQHAQSTVRLKPGEPQIVGGRQAAAPGHEPSQSWIVVTGYVGK